MGGDVVLDVCHMPGRHAGTEFEWFREFAITYPAPDGRRANRQDAGFRWGASNFCDADDAGLLHVVLLESPCSG